MSPFTDRGGSPEPVDQLVDEIGAVLLGFDGSDFPVNVDALGQVFDVVLRDVGFQLHIHQAFGGGEGVRGFPLFFRHGFG